MLMNKSASGLVVPQHLIEDQTPPNDFMRKLQAAFGPDMHCEWNHKKQRWVIEVCDKHNGSAEGDGFVKHTHLCQRYYAWLVRDEETDEYMPLCDRVIEKLHEKETWRKYGTGEAALERFRQESKSFDDDQANNQRKMISDVMQHARKENRVTFNKFLDLFRRHDMRPHTK